MKRTLNKKCKILIFIVLGIVCISILFLLLSNLDSHNFNMKYDDDKKSYSSCEYGYNSNPQMLTYNNYLSYNNGELFVKDFSKTNFTIFSKDSSSTISIPKDAYLLDNKIYYIISGKLYYKHLEDNKEIFIDDNCKTFCVSGNYIAYVKNNSVILTSINDFDNKRQITVVDDEIYYYHIQDGVLYLMERNSKEYVFINYNLDTLDEINRFSFGMKNAIDCICLSNGNFYFYYGETSGIFCANMKTGDCSSIIYHPCVKDMTVNDNKLYFISEKIEGEIITKTAKSKDNGVWELDISTAELRQLAEECEFSSLLATDNYVYCYKKEYLLPRGMANGWVKGYKIEQIPII